MSGPGLVCVVLLPAVVYGQRAEPVHFEPNRGQADAARQWVGSAGRVTLGFEAGAVDAGPVRLRFRGSNPAAAIGGEELLPGKSFYYSGNSPSGWVKNVPNYAKVRYRGLYPGIDAVFYGSGDPSELEYDLAVAPHADPSQIAIGIEGARGVAITAEGDLRIEAGGRVLVQKKPRVVQDGREIAAGYRVTGHEVRFLLDRYDPSRPLLIDPVLATGGPSLAYASYFGGTGSEGANTIVTDAAGNVYIAGQTTSPNFPAPPVTTLGDAVSSNQDAYVAKFDPTGKTLLMTVLLGGTGNSTVRNMAVDKNGYIYLVGQAGANFPLMKAFQKTESTNANGFVAKLDAEDNLIFSTYLGGTVSPQISTTPGVVTTDTSTAIQGVIPDSQGNVWVSGFSVAVDFPVTLGPQEDPAGYPYAFLAGFNASGGLVSSLVFNSGYYNPNLPALSTTIAMDNSGNIVMAGTTTGNLPVTKGAFQTVYGGGVADGFVAKVNPLGSPSNYLLAMTFLGGAGFDEMYGVTTDAAGDVYVTGTTNSVKFPGTASGMEPSVAGPSGAFIAKLSPDLTQELFATYLGGSLGTQVTPRGVRVDSQGNIFVAGSSDYTDLTPPGLGANASALQPAAGGNGDAFVVELNPAGSQAEYFTYFGGTAADSIVGMSLDGFGNLYAAGITSSQDLPVLKPAFQSGLATAPDAFFLRLNFASPTAVAISSVNVAGQGSANIAQNTWIEIHGANFAAAGTSATWSTAPDFLQGEMPTQLSGVSVTVNGKAAFIYYVSPTQVNVLTPLDSTIGPVQIVLTSGAASSVPFTAVLQTVSPSFLLFGATRYIAATHGDNSLLGPASMSVPGYTFTPAQANEEIVLYGAGFGLPGSALVNGSALQSGQLPSNPVFQVGGMPANVIFAGVISPGLYQFNVVVPSGLPSGDVAVTASYGGAGTPSGDLISLQ